MGPYETWATRLRLAWMGTVGQRIIGGFAAVLGDRGLEWAMQANLEHLPEEASDPASLLRIGADRLIPIGRYESASDYANRLTRSISAWRYAGSPYGLLATLYFDGYVDCVLVQQNGRYTRLTQAPTGDPAVDMEVGQVNTLIAPMTSDVNPAAIPIPAGSPWWTFDNDIEHCSRYAILLPNQPSFWMHMGVATFTGSASGWVTWSSPFANADYDVLVGGVYTNDTEISVFANRATKTPAGVVLMANAPFTGTVDVIAWVSGENPFCCPDAAVLANLRRMIKLWAPAKAACAGIFALVQGRYFNWPLSTFNGITGLWDEHVSQVIEYAAE